jgi:hypothetical protein
MDVFFCESWQIDVEYEKEVNKRWRIASLHSTNYPMQFSIGEIRSPQGLLGKNEPEITQMKKDL